MFEKVSESVRLTCLSSSKTKTVMFEKVRQLLLQYKSIEPISSVTID